MTSIEPKCDKLAIDRKKKVISYSMKVLKLSFMLILIGSALLLSSASESADPTNPKETKQQSNETQRNQDKSQKQKTPLDKPEPLTIEQFPHSPPGSFTTEDQTSKKETQPGPPRDSTWWFNLFIAIFTGCLVLVGVGQVIVYVLQAQYMRKGLRLTRKTAKAAHKALLVNRPYLAIINVRFIGEFVEHEPGQPTSKLVWAFGATVKNFGIGPADIVDYSIDWSLFNPPPPEPTIKYEENNGNRLNDSLIGPSEKAEDRLVVWVSLTEAERKTTDEDAKRIGIHGRVRYRGGHTQIYESRFFWWYFTENATFARALDPELNSHT